MEQNQLINYIGNEKILSDLCSQINKDIAIADFELVGILPSNTAFEQIFNQLFPLIQKLESGNVSKLNFILNRTDISEAQLKKEMKKSKEKPYSQLVTELIIKRELQKVVIRNKFLEGIN